MANNQLLKYPSDLNSANSYAGFIKFIAIEWTVADKRDLTIKNNSTILDTIVLPLPNNGLEQSAEINWSEDGGLAAEGIIGSIKHAGLSEVKGMLGDIGSKLSFQSGKAMNDLASFAFRNVEFRTPTFSWTFVPDTHEDAVLINNIIRTFETNSLPENQSSNILNYPSLWQIAVYAPTFKEVARYELAVCRSVSYNHMPDSAESYHEDGNPVKYELSVSFKELLRRTRDNVI